MVVEPRPDSSPINIQHLHVAETRWDTKKEIKIATIRLYFLFRQAVRYPVERWGCGGCQVKGDYGVVAVVSNWYSRGGGFAMSYQYVKSEPRAAVVGPTRHDTLAPAHKGGAM